MDVDEDLSTTSTRGRGCARCLLAGAACSVLAGGAVSLAGLASRHGDKGHTLTRATPTQTLPPLSLQTVLYEHDVLATTTPQPICEVGEWSSWAACSASCGGGHSQRSRRVNCHRGVRGQPYPRSKDAFWPLVRQTRTCAPFPCSVRCTVGDWNSWLDCDAACGSGWEVRWRQAHGNLGCPVLRDSRHCARRPCKQCHMLHPIQHAVDALLCDDSAHGQDCIFSCSSPYTPSGPLHCNDGVFSQASCVQDKCKAPTLLNDGGFNQACEGTPTYAWCRLRCREGYSPFPQLLTCMNAKWQEEAQCLPRACSVVPIICNAEPGSLSSCSTLAHGKHCSLRCAQGFHPTDNLICHLGQLNFPRCVPNDLSGSASYNTNPGAVCPEPECISPPSISFGDVQAMSLCAGAPLHAHCHIRCQQGYVLSPFSETSLVCSTGGVWISLTVAQGDFNQEGHFLCIPSGSA